MQANCRWELGEVSDNIIIYAHNMDDGSMFGDLEKFLKKSFWEEHKTLSFDTLTHYREYEIMAVFKTAVELPSDSSSGGQLQVNSQDIFAYYNFADAFDEEDFDEFTSSCKTLSVYDTGITASYGDKLITLSTCEDPEGKSRIVLVAKEIK